MSKQKKSSHKQVIFREYAGTMELPGLAVPDAKSLRNWLTWVAALAVIALIIASLLLNRNSSVSSLPTPGGSIVIPGSSTQDLNLQTTQPSTVFQNTESTPKAIEAGSSQDSLEVKSYQDTRTVTVQDSN